MRRSLPLLACLLACLALLAWGASALVHRLAHQWFEKDIRLRSELAVAGARQALVTGLEQGGHGELATALGDIALDERIMGAAAFDPDLRLRARTPGCPSQVLQLDLSAALRLPPPLPGREGGVWATTEALPSGPVHVSAVRLYDDGRLRGIVVLVHDMRFMQRREAVLNRVLLATFGILALAVSVVTIVFTRLSWRGWSRELSRFLRGETHGSEFRPILRDVRDLIDRIHRESSADLEGGPWGSLRLKQTLLRYLHGEKVVTVANREPYVHERRPDGSIEVVHPASGLVTALEPVMRACSGVWIAHGSGSADRDTVDAHSRVLVPPGEESYAIRRVWLTAEEEQGYYYGFANEGLWPLCHVADARPSFRTGDWEAYQSVNRRFAAAVQDEVDVDDPIVMVQDYHFALAPRLIRKRLPRATIITFWHVPWPNSERFGICPWRNEILQGMLGASIIGFHTQFHCNNFLETVDRYLETRIDRENNAVVQGGRSTLIRPYPISIEWPVRWLAAMPPPEECRRRVLAELDLPADALLGVGVDRLDYTKGIEERLAAVERLLERFPEYRGRFRFVQIAAPSRTKIERYRHLNESVEALASRINSRFGDGTYRPIIMRRAHHEPPAVFEFYRAADLCYVSSLHDGMNLVAKEFLAAREDERGVLILSQFTGAARELTEALIVNPYDLDQASTALAAALSMPVEEQRARMRSMRGLLAEFNVHRWAGRMLVDAARLRRRERLRGRLGGLLSRQKAGELV